MLFASLDAALPVIWAIIGDFFGRKHIATIRGDMTLFYMEGSALGPVVAGYLYDQSQSYTAVLCGAAGSLTLSGLLTALLIQRWRLKMAH